MDFWGKLAKSKQPSSKSYETLKKSLTDELVVCKLGFFSYFADLFKPFLTVYQTDKPMIPFLYEDLFKLLKSVFSIIVKPSLISNCETAYQLAEINLNKPEHFLSLRNINIAGCLLIF